MREIDRNLNNKLNYTNYKKAVNETNSSEEKFKENSQSENTNGKEINDLSALPATTFGKAMVSSDNISSDMEFLMANPQLAGQLNELFDNYIEQGHTYEDASRLLEAYRREFSGRTS